VLLLVPETYALDINLDLPDAQIGKVDRDNDEPEDPCPVAQGKNVSGTGNMKIKGHNVGEALRLKRARDLNVEDAKAEWHVGEGRIVMRC